MFTLSSYNHVYCLCIIITNNYIYQKNQIIILNEIRWNKQWKGGKESLANYSIINCFIKAYLVLDKLKFIEWPSKKQLSTALSYVHSRVGAKNINAYHRTLVNVQIYFSFVSGSTGKMLVR